MQVDHDFVAKARSVAKETLKGNAALVDENATFPIQSFKSFKEHGFLGMMLPTEYGGKSSNLATFSQVMETFGQACPSSGMCFLMHSVAAVTLAESATQDQKKAFLGKFAKNPQIMTQAVSEPGTGSHFYLPELQGQWDGNNLILNGEKKFCTSASYADWYLIYTKASTKAEGTNWLLVEKDSPGLEFVGSWKGMGLRGNSSISLNFRNVKIPADNLLGKTEGKGTEILFGPNCATFIIGQSSLNVGIAQAALEAAISHAKFRNHSVAGPILAMHQHIRFLIADMSAKVECARLKIQDTINLLEKKDPQATRSLFMSKIISCEASKECTDMAMQICGGIGFTKGHVIERLFRDARAGALMGPTNELMKDWSGKLLCDIPLM